MHTHKAFFCIFLVLLRALHFVWATILFTEACWNSISSDKACARIVWLACGWLVAHPQNKISCPRFLFLPFPAQLRFVTGSM